MWEKMIHALLLSDRLFEKDLEEKCSLYRATQNRLRDFSAIERLELSRREIQSIINYNNSMTYTVGKPILSV